MKNQIFSDSWHARVYLQAYVNDRTWIDPSHPGAFWDESQGIDLPEREAFWKFQEANPYSSWRDGESGEEFRGLFRSWNKARKAWCDVKLASYSTEKSAQIRSRLFSGKTSLCPYFWSVVYALVVYYGLVRGARWLFKSLSRAFTVALRPVHVVLNWALPLVEYSVIATWRPVLAGSGVASVGLLVLAMQFDVVRTPADFLMEVRQERAEKQRRLEEWEKYQQENMFLAQRKAEEDKELEILQRRNEWESFAGRAHPRVLQDDLARRADVDYRYFLEERKAEEERSARSWALLGERIVEFFTLVIGSILFFVVLAVLSLGVKWLQMLGKQIQATSLWATLKSRVQAVGTFVEDTKEFVWAFLKARKERVCPYLTVIEREHRT